MSNPVPGETVNILKDGTPISGAITDANGNVSFTQTLNDQNAHRELSVGN